jgi:hypothetical protein
MALIFNRDSPDESRTGVNFSALFRVLTRPLGDRRGWFSGRRIAYVTRSASRQSYAKAALAGTPARHASD